MARKRKLQSKITVQKRKYMLDLIQAVRIGRRDFRDIAKNLDRLKVPKWKQNEIAFRAKNSREYGSGIIKDVYYKRKR